MQAANVLQLPEIAIVGDGNNISVLTTKVENSTTNS